ncbi:MAG: restriction endonuclease subunit S [Chlamydiales bacterium]
MDKFVLIHDICEIKRGTTITKKSISPGNIPVIAAGRKPTYFHNKSNRQGNIITVSSSGAYAGFINYFTCPIFASDCFTIRSKDENKMSSKYIFFYLKSKQQDIYLLQSGSGQPHIYPKDIMFFKIPLVSVIQQKQIIRTLNEIEILKETHNQAYELSENLFKAMLIKFFIY